MTSKNKKKRTIAGFGSVADSNLKGTSNIDSDKNKDKDKDMNNDFLQDIVKSNKLKEETHSFKGYYLENEIVNTIEKMSERAGNPKGFKSELVNESLKKVFKDMGWL